MKEYLIKKIPFRIGFGFDIHSFTDGDFCILAGIKIPSTKTTLAHSDGDVLAHSLADAILGALSLPDIGHFFKNSDPQCKGMDSMKILQFAYDKATNAGYEIGNCDITIIAQKPIIGPFLEEMKNNLAGKLNLDISCIGIKATTNEKLDDIGAEKGIAVHSVCSLILK